MNESIQGPGTSPFASPAFLTSFWKRRLYAAFIVIMAFLDFRFIEVLHPDWQSGRLQDYITLFLSPEASLFFFPLIVYSVICFILLLVNAERYANLFFVRFGVYTGVILALQYSFLTILALNTSSFSLIAIVLAYVSPLIVKRIYQWLITKWSQKIIRNIFLVGVVIVLTLLIAQDGLLLPLIFLGAVAPFWSFLIANQTGFWLFKNHEGKLTIAHSLGLITWLAAYFYALRFNILKMYELYAALPTEPPDCYIATAAANGHPNFVRSRLVLLSNGKQMRVNSQLKHFKFAELTLQATVPRFHKLLRRLYDVIGKALSHKIQHPLLADITYLLLKPFEWLSIKMLRLLIPDAEHMASKIYDDHQNKPGVCNAH